ncbi:unnamed protein product, partial [Ixodes hexagonus]
TGSFDVVLWPRRNRQIRARVGWVQGSRIRSNCPEIRRHAVDVGPRWCGPTGRRRADPGGRRNPHRRHLWTSDGECVCVCVCACTASARPPTGSGQWPRLPGTSCRSHTGTLGETGRTL